MIARVRLQLVLLAAALSLLAVIISRFVLHAERVELTSTGELAFVTATVFGIALASGWVAIALVRRQLRELVDATVQVARDTSRRVPVDTTAPRGDEVRELAEWVNYLAEDATKNEQALAREKVLLAAVAEGLNQGVIAVDADHKIELLNDAARKMLGVSSTPVGEPLIEFMRVPAAFDLIESDGAGQAEVQLPSGQQTLIRVGRKWESEGRVMLLEDVTTVRRLETMRRDFVANVSHELRTPVAVIRANAETLLAGAKDDPVMAPKLIDGLHRNAERLARILADLLDLSRLDAGQYRLELTNVHVKAAIDQSLTAVETNATKRGVTVEVVVPADEPLGVKADPKALDQILVNLIDNGVKYTRAKGHVWVEAKPMQDSVRIEIRDDGPGIAEKHRERLFERFYRADQGRAREAGGTGLGLSIVKHLVESMDGQVGVTANTPSGSIFWLQLPRARRIAS